MKVNVWQLPNGEIRSTAIEDHQFGDYPQDSVVRSPHPRHGKDGDPGHRPEGTTEKTHGHLSWVSLGVRAILETREEET